MPRKKLQPLPIVDVECRRDTLSLRTIVRYDPNARRPSTPILVGKYVVGRRPLADSVHTLYLILDGNEIAGTQISIPDEGDCATAIKRLRGAKQALQAATADVVARVNGPRKPRALAVKEAA